MREIIFRGKRTDNGAWAEGSLLEIETLGGTKCFIVNKYSNFDGGELDEFKEVDPATIGQSAGLIDEYGDRKWEGDIFIFDRIPYVIEYDETELVWLARCYYDDDFTISLSEFMADEIEVIGNIHDNPELINKKTPEEAEE